MNIKLQRILGALIAGMLLASTCKEGDLVGIKRAELSTSFSLEVDEKAIFKDGNLLLEVSGINDNRCPINVNCITAGNAKVKLKVTGTGLPQTDYTFCLGQCESRFQKADTVVIQHETQAYQLILNEIRPYPGGEDGSKTAIFMIKRD